MSSPLASRLSANVDQSLAQPSFSSSMSIPMSRLSTRPSTIQHPRIALPSKAQLSRTPAFSAKNRPRLLPVTLHPSLPSTIIPCRHPPGPIQDPAGQPSRLPDQLICVYHCLRSSDHTLTMPHLNSPSSLQSGGGNLSFSPRSPRTLGIRTACTNTPSLMVRASTTVTVKPCRRSALL